MHSGRGRAGRGFYRGAISGTCPSLQARTVRLARGFEGQSRPIWRRLTRGVRLVSTMILCLGPNSKHKRVQCEFGARMRGTRVLQWCHLRHPVHQVPSSQAPVHPCTHPTSTEPTRPLDGPP